MSSSSKNKNKTKNKNKNKRWAPGDQIANFFVVLPALEVGIQHCAYALTRRVKRTKNSCRNMCSTSTVHVRWTPPPAPTYLLVPLVSVLKFGLEFAQANLMSGAISPRKACDQRSLDMGSRENLAMWACNLILIHTG